MALLHSHFLAAILAVVAFLSSGQTASAGRANFLDELERGHAQRIVVYGTSLTANSAWPGLFQQVLRKDYGWRVRVINSGGGGKDSRWGLANLERRVIRQRPDVVFIEFTINDALESSRLPVAESMANLEEMISRIRRRLPFCDVIVMIMNPPTGGALAQRPRIRDYESGYRRVAERAHCRLIDFSATWRALIRRDPALWKTYAPDGLHPVKRASREVTLPYLLRKTGYPPRAATPPPA